MPGINKQKKENVMWILLGIFAGSLIGVISIISKLWIKDVDSDFSTAIKLSVSVVFYWTVAGIKGLIPTIPDIPADVFVFLILSGIITGGTWVLYFKALSMTSINKAVPVSNSNTFLTTLFAMVILGEIDHLVGKIIGIVMIIVAIILMYERKADDSTNTKSGWFFFAFASAVCAALATVFSKIGIKNMDTTLAMAIRVVFVALIAWIIVFVKASRQKKRLGADYAKSPVIAAKPRELILSLLCGLIYGVSMLCFYEAVKIGVTGSVPPLDKLGVLAVSTIGSLVIKEKINKKIIIGIALMAIGALVMVFI